MLQEVRGRVDPDQGCRALMPWAGQSSVQSGVHLALKPCSKHQENVRSQTGEAQALGTILLPLEFKVLWLAGRWFPLFPPPLFGDLWFTPAAGDLDPKLLSLCLSRNCEVPAERFFYVSHLSRFLNILLSGHLYPHSALAVRQERRSCSQVMEKTLAISLQRLKCL